MNGFSRRIVARLFVGLCVIAGTAHAQSPLAAPNLPIGLAGDVRAIARQPDGGMIIGGQFTMVDGVARRNLARLRADGSLDPDWNPSADDTVEVVLVDAAGRVYVGGLFGEVDGLARNHIARIAGSGRGAVDPSWDPGHDLEFSTSVTYGIIHLALGARGEVFASGPFSSAQLGSRHIIKISADTVGTIDPIWNPPPDVGGSIATDTRGFLYAGLSKVSQFGHGDPIADWHPAFSTPDVMAVGPDGSLYVGSQLGFYNTNGRHSGRIAADSHGEFDPDWNPPFVQPPSAFAFDGDAMYISFEGIGAHESRIVRLSGPAGSDAVAWDVPGDEYVRALAVGPDGSLYAGGKFPTPWDPEQSAGLRSRLSLARLDATNGHVLPSADAAMPGTVTAIVPQSNGAVIIGGQFDIAGTTPRTNILRMTADGRVDPDWNPALDLVSVGTIAVDGDDDVYVSGQTPGPVFQGYINSSIIKLGGDGTGVVDPGWHLSIWGEVDVLAMDGHGGMYVGGVFGEFVDPLGGEVDHRNLWKVSLRDATTDVITYSRNAPVRALLVDADEDAVYIASGDYGPVNFGYDNSITRASNTTGSMQIGWIRSLPSAPHALARSPDGSLYAGGYFYEAADTSNNVLKFTRDGIPDTRWNAAAAIHGRSFSAVSALVVDERGDVYLGGYYDVPWQQIHVPLPYAQKRSAISGAAIAGWSPSFDGLLVIDEFLGTSGIKAMAVAANGTILIGGNFTMAGGEPRSGLRRSRPEPPSKRGEVILRMQRQVRCRRNRCRHRGRLRPAPAATQHATTTP